MKKIIECVPNVSEGRRLDIIEQLKESIRQIEGVQLLHTDVGYSANRTVFTFVGIPEKVYEAAYRLIEGAKDLIDMRFHSGNHPRLGAVDVCPFIPVKGISISELLEMTNAFAQRVGDDLGFPVYLYEYSSKIPGRQKLEDIRRGGYQGLEVKLNDLFWKPDFGPVRFLPEFGATIIGVRDFLVAYNINLSTDDVKIARLIAGTIRESGMMVKSGNGQSEPHRMPGLLKKVKAIGWYSDEFKCSQVSFNIVDYRVSSIYDVFKTTVQVAKKYSTSVVGTEIVGMIPLKSIFQEFTPDFVISSSEKNEKFEKFLKKVQKMLQIDLRKEKYLKFKILDVYFEEIL